MKRVEARAIVMAITLSAGACGGMAADPRDFVDNESFRSSPGSLEHFVAGAEAIFAGTIISSSTAVLTFRPVYTDTPPVAPIDAFETTAAETALAAGEPLPLALPTDDMTYDYTTYQASIERVYYDPKGILSGETVSFGCYGDPAVGAKPRHAVLQMIGKYRGHWEYLEGQYMAQKGERSLFVLKRDMDNKLVLDSGVYDRLDINGDKVRYYSNPQFIIDFNPRVTVPEFLQDLEAAIAAKGE